MGEKKMYRNLFGLDWRRFYIIDYFWEKGYSARIVAKLNDNGERGYSSVIELRPVGAVSVAASLDLSVYVLKDPDEAIQALELLLLFQ